jgi:PDZ domain-containing protein
LRGSAGGWRPATGGRKAAFTLLASLAILPASLPPDAISAELDLPPLEEGETIRSESYGIDGSGRLTWTRSTARQVGYLGVEIAPLDRDSAQRLNAPPFTGLLITSVDSDGPADRAGFIRDDIILLFGEQPAISAAQFSDLVEKAAPESEVDLDVLRDEVSQDFWVTLGRRRKVSSVRREADLPVIDDRPRTGMVLAEPGPSISARLSGITGAPGGLLVAEVLPGGPAYSSDVHGGDLLVEVGGRPVRDRVEWSDAAGNLSPGSPVEMVVFRRGRRLAGRVTPAKDATQVSEFNGPLWIYSVKSSAPESRFSLLWGALWRDHTRHEVLSLGSGERHVSSRELGVLLDIFRYSSSEGGSQARILWFIPLYSHSSTNLRPPEPAED